MCRLITHLVGETCHPTPVVDAIGPALRSAERIQFDNGIPDSGVLRPTPRSESNCDRNERKQNFGSSSPQPESNASARASMRSVGTNRPETGTKVLDEGTSEDRASLKNRGDSGSWICRRIIGSGARGGVLQTRSKGVIEPRRSQLVEAPGASPTCSKTRSFCDRLIGMRVPSRRIALGDRSEWRTPTTRSRLTMADR